MAKVVRNPNQAGSMSAPKRTTADIYKDIGLAALQGASLGFSDEVISAFSDKPIEEIRADMERFRETDPIKAYGAEIIGAMLTGGGAAIGAGRMAMRAGSELGKRASYLIGGGTSALEGGLYGAGTGETAGERLTGAGIGVPLGAVSGIAGQAIMPTLQKGARSMIKRGYPLTAGQAFGGTIGSIEQKVSAPFVQEAIAEARRRPQQMFMRETIDEALKPLGVKVPEGMTGETAVDFAEDAISEAYSSVVPKAKFSTVEPDNQIAEIIEKAQKDGVFDADDVKAFTKDLNEVYTSLKRNGSMTGQLFKESESMMSSQIKSYKMGNQRRQMRVMRDIQSVLRDQFASQNPDLPDLQAANKAFRNMRPIVKLSDRRAATGGEFGAGQLVRAETQSRPRDAAEVIRAREARDILGQTVPDSGTAGRLELGRALTSPRSAIGLGSKVLASTLMYDYPKLGRGLVKLPAYAVGYGATPAALLGGEEALTGLGLLGE